MERANQMMLISDAHENAYAGSNGAQRQRRSTQARRGGQESEAVQDQNQAGQIKVRAKNGRQ